MPASPFDSHETPRLNAPVRWAIRVLALLALVVAGYLALTGVTHSPVAGCGGAGQIDCDEVLSTGWSRWLGMPVAIGGAACYLALFVLSLFLGWRDRSAQRWIVTLLLMLSLVATGSAVWFTILQLAVIGKICLFCLVVHTSGVLIAGLVVASLLLHQGQPQPGPKRVANLAIGLPVPETAPHAAVPPRAGAPSWGLAGGGAALVLLLLIGGQWAFPAKTYVVQAVKLDESTDLTDTGGTPEVVEPPSPTAQTHVVQRIPTPSEPVSPDDHPSNDNSLESVGDTDDASVAKTAAKTNRAPDAGDPQSVVPAVADLEPQRERKVTFLDGSLTIDMYRQPVLGSPEAPHVVVELMDYTCSHCREAHAKLKKARRRYGDQLAIVIMPVPLEADCNRFVRIVSPEHRHACKIAYIAMSIAMARPADFAVFHDWLLADEEKVPSLGKVVVEAFRLVDKSRLRELTQSDRIQQRIKDNVELMGKLEQKYQETDSGFGLPVQIVGDVVLSGAIDDEQDMYRVWEEQMGIKPVH